jgi:methanol metabolism-related c-type cytochrome
MQLSATTPRSVERSRFSHYRSELTHQICRGAWIHSTRRLVDSNIEDMLLRMIRFVAVAMILVASGGGVAFAEDRVDPTAVKSEDGKYLDKDGNPTFKVAADGPVDWYTYSGYRRYHSDCHVCHGPDGMGSTYAPALTDSLKTMSYADFLGVVASGRKNVSTSQENVMPAFGDNPNVACYMDDIYVYLRARANDAIGRVRPPKHEDKPEAYTKAENACMGK